MNADIRFLEDLVSCVWTQIEVDDVYLTYCGNAFSLSVGGTLEEHGFKFCIFCGLPIELEDSHDGDE